MVSFGWWDSVFIRPQMISQSKRLSTKKFILQNKIRKQQFPTRKSLCAVGGVVVDNVMVFVAGILSQVERFSLMMMVDWGRDVWVLRWIKEVGFAADIILISILFIQKSLEWKRARWLKSVDIRRNGVVVMLRWDASLLFRYIILRKRTHTHFADGYKHPLVWRFTLNGNWFMTVVSGPG